MTRFQIIFLKPTKNILHTDDRIIDEFSDSDDDTSEGHDIDPDSKLLECYRCDEECDRQREDSHERRTDIHEKESDDDSYDDNSISKSIFYIGESELDEVRLSKEFSMELDSFWKRILELFELRLYFFGEGYSIGIGGFRYTYDHSSLSIDECVSASLTIATGRDTSDICELYLSADIIFPDTQ